MPRAISALLLAPLVSIIYCKSTVEASAPNTFSATVHELVAAHAELRGTPEKALRRVLDAYTAEAIPQIVHQTWKTHKLPQAFRKWSASWTAVNAGWLHVLWSDEENRRLVQQHFPWFLPTYDGFSTKICQVDAVRPLILYQYGGVYADLDSQALKPMRQLLGGKKVVLAQMGNNASFDQSLPNAFMASMPRQQFWLHFARQIVQGEKDARGPRLVESVAGPSALKQAFESYRRAHGPAATAAEVTVLPPQLIFPVDWSAKRRGLVPAECDFGGHPHEFDAQLCVARHFQDAYSVQWWAHSWTDKGAKRLGLAGRN